MLNVVRVVVREDRRELGKCVGVSLQGHVEFRVLDLETLETFQYKSFNEGLEQVTRGKVVDDGFKARLPKDGKESGDKCAHVV